MSRKFVTDREIAFIDSISRELHQHVVDEEVLYYAIDLSNTNVHRLYNEAVQKTWLPPVKITARVLYDNPSVKTGLFGPDSQYSIEVYFHLQELQQRSIQPRDGDFVEYGQVVYEIVAVTKPQAVFGQINQKLMVKCTCVPSREGQFQIGNQSERGKDNSHPVPPNPAVPNPTGKG